MPTTCCVVKCGSRGERDAVCKFYKIPSELNFRHKTNLNELSKRRRQKWIDAIKRADISEKTLQYARVCNKHFVSGKPSALTDTDNIDWVPSLALGYGTRISEETKEMKLKYSMQKRASKRRLVVDDQQSDTESMETTRDEIASPISVIVKDERFSESQQDCSFNRWKKLLGSQQVDQTIETIDNKICGIIADDKFDAFGKNVAHKLRSLPNNQRLYAEKIINDALFEAELGNLSRQCLLHIPSQSLPFCNSPTLQPCSSEVPNFQACEPLRHPSFVHTTQSSTHEDLNVHKREQDIVQEYTQTTVHSTESSPEPEFKKESIVHIDIPHDFFC